MRRHAVLVLLMACERAAPPAESPTLIAPAAPDLEAMRTSSAAHDPPPPKPAMAPDLVGLPSQEKQWFLALTPAERHSVRQICRIRRSDPCAGRIVMKRPEGAGPDPTRQLLATVPDDGEYIDRFCVHANGRRGGCNTPLVIAFDGQPVDFTAPPAGRFAFEPGVPVASGWPTAATPWIALDRDGDGAITSGAELFGDATGDANDGFEALAALDANGDGVIDRRDPAFGALLLWADADGDRKSSPSELRPLASIVVELPLAHHIDPRCVQGNCEGERGSVVWRDGDSLRHGAVVDVYLESSL